MKPVPFLLFLFCSAAVLYGLFTPDPPRDPFSNSDKVAHLLAFAAVGFTGRWAFAAFSPTVVWPCFFVVAPWLEWLQHQVSPMRSYSLWDALANALGVFLALLLWKFVFKPRD